MEILKTEHCLCVCCMEKHDLDTVKIISRNIYKGQEVLYPVVCFYCKNADVLFEDEEMVAQNHNAMMEAYQKKVNNPALAS